MRIRQLILLYIISFFPVVSLNAGENISLSASLNRFDIPFEESVELKLEIKWQGDITSYAFELVPLPELENLKVLGTSSAISSGIENDKEITTRTFKYTLKPTGSGIGTIEPIVLDCIAMPDSVPGQLSTQLMKVNIAKPIPIKEDSGVSLFLYLMLAGLMIAAVFIVVLKNKKGSEIEPVKSAEEYFSDSLADIKANNQSDRKLFFTKLNLALTEYVKLKYKIETSGQTSKIVS
ncbi:MAG: hypothetical protein GY865_13510, partial [candidate division Zixibacteria bacterium]|nr:hypothetical protein [candidate division Zixibacteria bacterium]